MCRVLALLSLLFCASATAATIEEGKRLYREGLLPSGQAVEARVEGDVPLRGAAAACMNCHRRSGYGTAEGGRVIRPITPQYLFQPNAAYTRVTGITTAKRPIYTEASLARAIRHGVGADGQLLSALMPRYRLDDTAMNALIAYLNTLAQTEPIGVDAGAIHFATILDASASAHERASLLAVLNAFFDDHNAEIRQEARRGARATLGHSRKYRSYRKWQLHVWTVSGDTSTWRAQLDAAYAQRPVFAVIGGASRRAWEPVHAFCQQQELPCLFPSLSVPPAHADVDFYSLYWSKGISLDARALATHLKREAGAEAKTWLQVFRDHDEGRSAAAAFEQVMKSGPQHAVHNYVLPAGERVSRETWEKWLRDKPNGIVLWLRAKDFRLNDVPAVTPPLYLSSALAPVPDAHPMLPRVRLVHRFALPGDWPARRERLERWLQARDVALGDERLQADTYLSLGLLSRALSHLRDGFSREYLIERIEHMMENSAWLGAYPALSLGTGQRYAAKGAYILRYAEGAGWQPIDERIVPE